jgi:hypothetical protein
MVSESIGGDGCGDADNSEAQAFFFAHIQF